MSKHHQDDAQEAKGIVEDAVKNKPKVGSILLNFFENTIVKIIAGATTVIGLVVAGVNVYENIDTRFKGMMDANNQAITLKIQELGVDMAEMHHDDLSVRIRILKREIQTAQERAAGSPADEKAKINLERMRLKLDALQDQRDEVARKWLSH